MLRYLYYLVLFSISFLLCCNIASSQVTLYSEDFDDVPTAINGKGQSGTTYDMSDVSNWTIDVGNGVFEAGDHFKVQGSQFYVTDADAPDEANANWWYSTITNISGYSDVTVSASLIRSINSNSGLNVKFYYKIGAGSWTAVGASYTGGAAAGSVVRSQNGLSGTTIQVKVAYWGLSSTGSLGHDNVTIVGTPAACTPPSTQASGLTFPSVGNSNIYLSWTNGNGDNVIVVAKKTSSTTSDPGNSINYTANSNFGSGTQIGTGNFVVYKGIGTSVLVTGLEPNVNYTFSVYAFNDNSLKA